MTTVKEILSANRESIISSIKWVFKVWASEDVKAKMIEFLAFAEANASAEDLSASKKVKTDLKYLVQKMSIAQEKEKNIKVFGTERPKLRDIMGKIADHYEEKGLFYNPIIKDYVKR